MVPERSDIPRRLLVAVAVGLWAPAATRAAEPIPFELPAGAKAVYEKGRQIGWGLGLKANTLTVLKADSRSSQAHSALGPLAVDAEFHKRDVTTTKAWEKLRDELRKRMAAYFGAMPPADAPLAVKVEQRGEDRKDHTFKVVSIAFDKTHRGKIGLLVPKALGRPAGTILLNDRWGGGIDRATGGIYSRAIATHFAREGFIVAVINHWDCAESTPARRRRRS